MAYFLCYIEKPLLRKMRKTNIVFVLSCFLLILACSKNSDDNPIEETANLLAAGDSANDILSNDKFTKLKIEIAYVTGFRPNELALDEFVEFIKEHTFKEDIQFVYKELPSPDKKTITLLEVVKLESENRTVYNDGDTLGIYIYFSDAASTDDDTENNKVTLGAVYRNTSMVIYEETIKRFSILNNFIPVPDLENATINHEFGHLLGLVDLGTEQVNEHEDPEAERHCVIPGCLMRGELQFNPSKLPLSQTAKTDEFTNFKSACAISGQSVLNILKSISAKGDGIAPDLDSECILDLRANGGR